jgi:hypothetical protein
MVKFEEMLAAYGPEKKKRARLAKCWLMPAKHALLCLSTVMRP